LALLQVETMKSKELFDACVKKCVWCAEQWPLVATGGKILHVGPYTKDRKLFSYSCAATTIREAFEYVGYEGGEEIEWKVPIPRKLGANAKASSPRNRSFWRNLTECSLHVSEWPDWKRSVDLYGKKTRKDTPSDLKRMRDELRYSDALEYWAHKECTEGLQYHPTIKNGRIVQPTCNWEIGCITCWGRYETFSNELHEADCY
jgi:hypothetical protein